MKKFNLYNKDTAKSYEVGYSSGYDHKYPNENIVRLEKLYFKTGKGRVLDYGFGFGANAVHLAERGYDVEGIEIAKSAVTLTENKLSKKKDLRNKIKLKILSEDNSDKLPYSDEYFDYILSNQTVYYLGSLELINHLLDEFYRILKSEGRMIISLLGPTNMLCIMGKEIEKDVFEYVDVTDQIDSIPLRTYVFRDEKHIREVFKKFKIDEIGSWDNSYFGRHGFHFVVMCRKP